jgi:hypothetical protein
LGLKKDQYANIRIPYYVVWDPLGLLSTTPLQVFRLHPPRTYDSISPTALEGVGLGLCVWHGVFEQTEDDWLRWCDNEGVLIPLGEERAEQERQRAEQERQRAEQEHQRAEKEHHRAEKAEQRLARLEAQLRQRGIEPSNGGQ